MFKILTEILSTPHYCVRPGAFEAMRNAILGNIDRHMATGIEKENRLQAFAVIENGELVACPQSLQDFKTQEEVSKDEAYQSYLVDPSARNGRVNPDDDTALINILRLTGPMTRSGDECSYGSKDHRDLMMQYANNSRVAAHIIYTNTPGGMASTIRDYRQAINYCHERGQKVYMFCDGDVASGGAFLACLCDEVWANNQEDEIGSLGMYCAFFSLKDGAENKITSEVYHELYADASTDKNGWYRKAADGDMAELRKDLNADLGQMLANAKKDRPSIKDSQLTGKMYKMGEVKGSLVDRFGSLAELCKYALAEHQKRNGAALPAKEQAAAPAHNSNTNNQNQMKTYSNIAAMIGEEAFESQTDGYVSLNETQADALEKRAGEVAMMQAGYTALTEELKQAKAEKAELVTKLSEAQAQLAEAQEKSEENEALETAQNELADTKTALETVTAERDEALQASSDKDAQLEAKETELSQANETLAAKETELATANQTIADLTQKIETLNAAPGNDPQAGESAKTNGSALNAPQMKVNSFEWNPALSVEDNLKLKDEHDQALKALALGR